MHETGKLDNIIVCARDNPDVVASSRFAESWAINSLACDNSGRLLNGAVFSVSFS